MTHLNHAFQKLDTVLTRYQTLWQAQPFINDDLPWFHSHPHLKEALLALDDSEAMDLHDNQQQRMQWFYQLEPKIAEPLFAFTPAPVKATTSLVYDRFDKQGISGRKWEQITAFASALPNTLPNAETALVDWCAGKGHLSRMVQRSLQQTVHCIEWDSALVSAGKELAAKQQLDIRYYHHDVMQPAPTACSGTENIHIGLHACGDLHRQLLKHVAHSQAKGMALSPCCYHKITTEQYQPLSQIANTSTLELSRPSLHLAVQDPVTARRGERVLRQQERVWRLGFDLLQRDIRGVDHYLKVPSSNSKLLRQDFASFCRWAAAAKNIDLSDEINFDHYLERGKEKHQRIMRLDLLRRVFNRPLELWLVLDRALYLEEQGYDVEINQFCDSAVSPRNLLIRAQRR